MKNNMKGIILVILAIGFSLAGVYLMNSNLKGYSIFSVSVALVLLFMGITYIIDNSSPERMYSSNIKEILNTFDSVLVKSNNIPNLEGRNIIILESIDDLVDAQLEIRKPICYLKQNESCSFMLFDEKEIYICIEKLNEEVVSPIEIELENIKTKIKSSDEMDSSMIREIDKTTIVKLSNKKSYKVSPIRESNDRVVETQPLNQTTQTQEDNSNQQVEELNIEIENNVNNNLIIEPIRKISHDEYLQMKQQKLE